MKGHGIYSFIFLMLFLLLTVTIAFSVVLLMEGAYGALALWVGAFGCATFLLILFGSMFAGSGTKNEDILNARQHKYFCRWMNQAESNPNAFKRKLCRLGRQGNIYIAFLLFGIICSLAGLVVCDIVCKMAF